METPFRVGWGGGQICVGVGGLQNLVIEQGDPIFANLPEQGLSEQDYEELWANLTLSEWDDEQSDWVAVRPNKKQKRGGC